MSRWQKFWRLSSSERRLVMTAALLLPVVGAMLRVLGFARSQSILAALTRGRVGQIGQGGQVGRGRHGGGAGSGTEALDDARASARLVRAAAARGLFHATCLPQSLVLWSLLRRKGEDAVVRVGVRKADDRVHAHAWVEYRGVVVNDEPDVHDQFTAFDRVTAQ
jgi:hypothetical protein